MNCLKDFFARLFYNPNKAADKNFKFLMEQDNKMIWVKEHGYKIQVSLETMGNLFIIVNDMEPEDVRRFSLSNFYGFDVYSVKSAPTFSLFADFNSDWLQII